jgi:hypothetical protein
MCIPTKHAKTHVKIEKRRATTRNYAGNEPLQTVGLPSGNKRRKEEKKEIDNGGKKYIGTQ